MFGFLFIIYTPRKSPDRHHLLRALICANAAPSSYNEDFDSALHVAAIAKRTGDGRSVGCLVERFDVEPFSDSSAK